ncbi:MAG: phosphoribosylglycinamide formyltransferase [Ignavibacteriales bacterium]|nr:phosphoribosylglycinamide formyltransferase [Ignavibacteriales bacterium]
MHEHLNIAVFASGKGSNFKAILEAINAGRICNAKIVLVISNNSDAGALVTAREHHIPARHVSRKQFSTDDDFNAKLMSLLVGYRVNFIVLAGYMKKIDSKIVQSYKNRIINIHPALLPKFGGSGMYGIHVHEAVIASKENLSGASVHIVDEEYDRGPVVLQKTVAVDSTDTPESLAAKVLQLEHEIYPEAVRLFAEGRIKVIGKQVSIS